MNELGRVLLNLCTLVPAGIVCFLPSYDYSASTLAHLTSTGVMEKIAAKKQVRHGDLILGADITSYVRL